MKLTVVLEPSAEGGFTVVVPSLSGCISEGETVDEALANIREAIALYLDQVDDDGVFPPSAEMSNRGRPSASGLRPYGNAAATSGCRSISPMRS